MTDVKISALTTAGTLDGTESLVIVQGGSTVKLAASQIGTLPNLYLPQWRAKGASRWRQIACTPFPTNISTAALSSGYQSFMPMDLGDSITFDQWGIVNGTIGVGGTTQTIGLAIYAADATTNLPSGSPLYSLDTKAPAINCKTGTANALNSSALSSSVTIPAGRYWLSTLELITGTPTTTATPAYLTGNDPRITYSGAFTFSSISTALIAGGVASFGAVPALNANSYFGRAVWLRQVA